MRAMRRWMLPSLGLTAVAAALAAVPPSNAGFTAASATGANTFSVAASFDHELFLHDHPTPATGDSQALDPLPLSTVQPTSATLFNYDTDRDAFPGLFMSKGDGLSETHPVKFQRWRHVPSGTLSLAGPAELTLWSATKDFNTGKQGHIEVGLYDCDAVGVSCVLLAAGAETISPWPSSWQPIVVDLGTVTGSIGSTRSLVLKVAVGQDSHDDLWFAYDTSTYLSRLTIAD